MPDPWFISSRPVLDQLGATFGSQRPFTTQGGYGGGGVDYTDVINNQIQQQQQQADRDYGLKKQGLDQQYSLAKMQARSQQERNQIDREYQQAQVQLARDRLAQDAQQFSQNLGQRQHEFDVNAGFNQRDFGQHQHEFDIGQGNNVRDFGQRQYEFGANLGENQRQFNTQTGYNLLNMQANLRGPANYFQASNLAHNVAGDPNSATFLDALRSNTHLPGFSAQGGVPDAVSLNSLAAQQGNVPMMAGGAMAEYQQGQGAQATAAEDPRLAQIRGIYAAGAHKLAPGALEQMTPTERGLFGSGIDAIGGDQDTFLDQYRRSRVGQRLGMAAAA